MNSIGDTSFILQFAFATLLPVAATILLTWLGGMAPFAKLGFWPRQILCGLVFGGIAVYGTEVGIVTHDAIMNVRDAAPLAAGFFFGGPAGIIAGMIGGIERWLAALWGRGMFTRLGCSAATALAGIFAASVRRFVFNGKRPTWLISFSLAAMMEVIHLLLIFLTNMDDARHAFVVVWDCSAPMVTCNALSVMLCCIVSALMQGEGLSLEHQNIASKVRAGMFRAACTGVIASYIIISLLLNRLFRTDIASMSGQDSEFIRDLVLLVSTYLQIILIGVLFIGNYILMQRVVVNSVWQINNQLHQITSGDLSAQVDVRDSDEFSSLSDDINATVGALRDAIAAESARIDADLATAKAIQESALPRTFPPFPYIDAFDLYASMDAAREIGGDFYDFFLVGNHTLGFLIADVSGKGIPAALFMMKAKSELANSIRSGIELDKAITLANQALCEGNDEDMFVTVWAATLDYVTGKLTYVNAGHNYPLLRRDGKWQWLREVSGLFLGGLETESYTQETLMLAHGDELVLYTDGVTEAFDAHNAPYGEQHLEEFLQAHPDQGPHALVDSLRTDVAAWAKDTEQSDDVTILCLEYLSDDHHFVHVGVLPRDLTRDAIHYRA